MFVGILASENDKYQNLVKAKPCFSVQDNSYSLTLLLVHCSLVPRLHFCVEESFLS